MNDKPKKNRAKPSSKPKAKPQAETPADPNSSSATLYVPSEIQWWDQGRIAPGGITILDGDPGAGKTMLLCEAASQISNGRAARELASTGRWAQRGVLFITESDPARVIVPRLVASGADLTRVHFWGRKPSANYGGAPQLPGCLDDMRRSVALLQVGLVVFDPVTSSMRAGTLGEQESRMALEPLVALCQEMNLICLVTRHMNKNQQASALYRGLGSIALVGCAHTALLVTRDPRDREKRILSVTKNNLGASAKPIMFRILPEHPACRIEWGEEIETDPDEILRGEEESGRRDAMEDSKRLLMTFLQHDWKPAKAVIAEAESCGLKERTLRSAKAVLGVQSRRVVLSGEALWEWGPPAKGWPKCGESLDDSGTPPDNQ